MCVCVCVLSRFRVSNSLRPHGSPPGSSVYGILQARILEWVAMTSSRGSSWPRDWNFIFCIAGGFFTPKPPGKPSSRVHFLFPLTWWGITDGLLVVLIQADEKCWSLSWQFWVVILALPLPCSPTSCPLSVPDPIQGPSLPLKKEGHTLLPTSFTQQHRTVTIVWILWTPHRIRGIDNQSW